MKSYAGLLFHAIAVEHNITLIDEPEAFLHPPQMRRIGETLAKETVGQLFVSTHSADILKGFLDGTNGNLRIIRLQRYGNENHATETSPQKIRELWNNPELKYSNALDGIFHERSILCEGDSDCRLLNSISDHTEVNGDMAWWRGKTAQIRCASRAWLRAKSLIYRRFP